MKKTTLAFVVLISTSLMTCAQSPPNLLRTTEPGKVATEESISLVERELTIKQLDYPMVPLRGGSYSMGNAKKHDGWSGQNHDVTLPNLFWMGKYEVTQKQFQAIMGRNPSTFSVNRGENWEQRPVETVTWEEASEFCKKLTIDSREIIPAGYEYRLPTEAEWEYAARRSHSEGSPAAYIDQGPKHTPLDVTKTAAQATSIHGLFGNVMEWCHDWYGQYPQTHSTDPTGPTAGRCRVVRGGSWLHGKELATPTHRNYFNPSTRSCFIGFRFVLAPALTTNTHT